MNKLWVYGCSFSDPFNIGKDGEKFDNDGVKIIRTDYWGSYLSKKLNMTCITRSKAGAGLNHIKHQVELDFDKWHKDDIIIISPSFLYRITIMEFSDFDFKEEIVPFLKPINKIFEYNQLRWRLMMIHYQKLGYNVYTWLIDDMTDISNVKNIITPLDNVINWKKWMDLHLEYWINPISGEWHFNEFGHIAVSDIMYNFIKKIN